MSSLEKRFGSAAVEDKIIGVEQLQEGLKIQVEENVAGKPHRLIGDILMGLGYMTREQVARILLLFQND